MVLCDTVAMNILLVALFLSAGAIALLNLVMYFREDRHFRSFFVWGIAMVSLPMLFTLGALIAGIGYWSFRAPGNFHPFVIFTNLFFVPAGLISGLMGLFESRDLRRQQSSLGAGPDRPPRRPVRKQP